MKKSKRQIRIEQEQRELERIVEILGEIEEFATSPDTTDDDVLIKAPIIMARLAEANRLGKKYVNNEGLQELLKDFSALTKFQQTISNEINRRANRIVHELVDQVDREFRIPMEQKMCENCNKKPVRIDDKYCKRCAREKGIVVHGKI